MAVVGVAAPSASLGENPSGGAASEQTTKVNPDGWTSSAVCAECHQAIHAVWQHSQHANAWTNGIFQAAYQRSIDANGKESSRVCLRCHTPTVRHGKDYDVSEAITAEGVTCDFCHSVSSVDLSDTDDPIRFSVGKTKYGPLRHAQSPAHEIIDSQLHTRSEFCAGCHEFKNAAGATVLGTYGEWKQSSYARRGTQCQDCHMPLVPGRVVALNIKEDSGKSVNLHDISGSHDIDKVRKAVTLDLAGYEWLGDRVRVYMKVANVGSGHCFPTGLPMHRAVLEVVIQNGSNTVGRREIPFEIVMLDKNGRPLRREHEVMIHAVSTRSDTRLRPNEVRTIDVSFRDVHASRLVLTAKLYYMYTTETLIEQDGERRFEPVEMKFLVASRRNTMKPLGG